MSTAAVPLVTRMEVPDREAPPVKEEPKGPTIEQRLEAMERELNETKESAKVWEAIANNRQPAPAPKADATPKRNIVDDFEFDEEDDEEEDAPIEGDTPEAVLDELSKLGTDALSKRGFMRKADVVKLVRAESRKAAAAAATQAVQRGRQAATTESQIMTEFPELADRDSEFFKITSEHVRRAVQLDRLAAKNPATLYLAARAAKAELGSKGRGSRTRGREDEQLDDDIDDHDDAPPQRQPARRSSDRQDRIDAQRGDRGHSRSRIETNSDADVELSEDALDLIGKLGITKDEYKTSAVRTRGAARGRR